MTTYRKIEPHRKQVVPAAVALLSESVSGMAENFINVLLCMMVFLIKGKRKSFFNARFRKREGMIFGFKNWEPE